MLNRRQFLRICTIAGAAMVVPWDLRKVWAYGQSPTGLSKFKQALPGLGDTGIPVASPDTTKYSGEDYYEIELAEFTHQFHPDLPASKVWGYADITGGKTPNHRYLGGVIVATKGKPARIVFTNKLPSTHPLPIDTSSNFPDSGKGQNRASVHLHGGFVPWNSDGGPNGWFTPDGTHGDSFKNPSPAAGKAEYYWPNDQSARLMWYHDHAHDITRLNAYVGLATGYLVTDDVEQTLINSGILPDLGIPLIIQDKTFVDGTDSNYIWGKKGDLWYPYQYEINASNSETGRWDYGPSVDPKAQIPNSTLPAPSVVPEFFSDTIVINGAAYPYLTVEPRHYRFRILNGSQARFYNLQLYYADSTGSEADLKKAGPRMIQIGTEGGFLPFPVALNDPPKQIGFDTAEHSPTKDNANRYNLLLAPAERADIIINFSDVPVGSKLILYSDSPAPFPSGDVRNDFYTGDKDQSAAGGAPTTQAGYGPNTRTLMQFVVTSLVGDPDPASMDVLETLAVKGTGESPLPQIAKLDQKAAVKTRDLTLNEDFDDYGRLIQRLGTNVQNGVNNQGLPTWGRNYMDETTEMPTEGDIEIWRIFNLTGDTHPIHFHLVNVQVISRQPFDVSKYNGTPKFLGPARPPDKNEQGWKETVRMNPNECTTVIMKFDLPSVPFTVPESPMGGHEYVWHCHILEHEEHDMMRPLIVTPASVPPPAPGKLTAVAAALSTGAPAVALSWTDNSTNDTGSFIDRALDANFTKELTTFTIGEVTEYTDTSVQPNTRYYYRVYDSNAVGASPYSNTATVLTTGQGPTSTTDTGGTGGTGTTADITFVSSNKNSITISWVDSFTDEKGFYIERRSNVTGKWKRIAKVKANKTTFTDKGLKKNTAYWYRVQAYNATGLSSYTSVISAFTQK